MGYNEDLGLFQIQDAINAYKSPLKMYKDEKMKQKYSKSP